MDAITFEHVFKNYRNTRAVTNLPLKIDRETVVALLGPNGAGKTTALSMMLGLIEPTSGKVTLLGHDPKLPHTRQHIGAMLQQVTMPDKTTARGLIDLFRSYYEHCLDTNTLLELAGLKGLAARPVRRLSGGQQRRLQFALAMAGDPHKSRRLPGCGWSQVRQELGRTRGSAPVASQGWTKLIQTTPLQPSSYIGSKIVGHGYLLTTRAKWRCKCDKDCHRRRPIHDSYGTLGSAGNGGRHRNRR